MQIMLALGPQLISIVKSKILCKWEKINFICLSILKNRSESRILSAANPRTETPKEQMIVTEETTRKLIL